MNNKQVAAKFAAQEKAQGSHYHSNGVSLFSYGWWEVARWVKGKIVVRKGGSYSGSTSAHRNLVRQYAVEAKKETPVDQGTMNL